jgi:hypothetical protein
MDDYEDRRREMRYDADDYHRIVNADELFYDLLSDAKDVGDLEDVLNNLSGLGVDDDDIGEMLDSNLDYVLDWFDSRIDASSESGAVEFIMTIDDMYPLGDLSVSGKVRSAIMPHKDVFIKGLLINMRRGYQQTRPVTVLKKLADWPELDIILHSLEHDKKIDESERRVNQQSAVDTWYHRLINDLEHDYHDTIAWSLIMMGRADARLSQPSNKTFLDRHKGQLLKRMLIAVANRDDQLSYSDRELREMMLGVRKLGLDWPEFDVIEKSLGIGASNAN